MVAPSRSVHVDVERRVFHELLAEEPFRFRFFQAVRLLARVDPQHAGVGNFVQPSTEVVRFAARASSEFPASEIQALKFRDSGPPVMTVNFMGLTGPTGILPLVYTELIMDRVRNKDHSLREMLDVFNHRMISLFYKAWEKHKFPVPYEREGADAVSSYLKSFLGLGTAGLSDRQDVSDRSFIYYAGLLAHRPRSAGALQQLLADYFEVPVEVQQFCGSWYKLDRSAQTKLVDTPLESARLGFGAVVGDEIWDLHAGVRLRFGPLTRTQYVEFLPGSAGHRALKALLKFYANEEYAFELQLVLKRDETPPCELGAEGADGTRLGWLTWAKTATIDRDPADTLLQM